MTEPRTSRRVARVVLLVLLLGLVAVALPIVPAVWEWAVYGEWKPIWMSQRDPTSGSISLGDWLDVNKNLRDRTQVHLTAEPLDAGKYSYFKAKQKRLRWLPGKDLIILQIGKEEFQGMFPNAFKGSRIPSGWGK